MEKKWMDIIGTKITRHTPQAARHTPHRRHKSNLRVIQAPAPLYQIDAVINRGALSLIIYLLLSTNCSGAADDFSINT